MHQNLNLFFLISLSMGLTCTAWTQDLDSLFEKRPKVESRWSTFENPNGVKGRGGISNKGAKGHPMETLHAGETKVLMNVKGRGAIRRIWMTLRPEDPQTLRTVRIEMYWDGAETPAVSAPLGDFFASILGESSPFENALFSNPEGRSFNSYIPMPFLRSARVQIINDGKEDIDMLFYEIDYTLNDDHENGILYFHAHWRREPQTTLGRDFEILPKISGEGRYLGAHLGVILNPENKGWWGEGEVKVYLDGDTSLPTLVGTGTEDYIGTGWGQGRYVNRYQGCLVADGKRGHFTFYRYHLPDPVYFHQDCRVTIQQMGGAMKNAVAGLLKEKVPVRPVAIIPSGGGGDEYYRILDQDPVPKLSDRRVPSGWVNHYRQDDWSVVAFFYLDRPENGLPPIAGLKLRTQGIE